MASSPAQTALVKQDEPQDGPPLWERQPYDTDASFCAFQIFCRLGPARNHNDCWEEYAALKPGLKTGNGPSRHLKGWSAEHNWFERAAAYDDHLWTLEVAAREVTMRKVAEIFRESAEDLARSLVEAARSGNAAALKDFHDRAAALGVSPARIGSKSANNGKAGGLTQINIDLSGQSADSLLDLAASLAPMIDMNDL